MLWHQSLSSGVRSLDVGMENLFFILRQLLQADVECRRKGFLCPRDRCGKVEALVRYLERNFLREETEMRRHGYPELDQHAAAHRDLVDRLRDLQDGRVCGRMEQGAVLERVHGWAVDHIEAEDKPLGRWLLSAAAE